MSWTDNVPSYPPVPIDELYSSAKKWAEKGDWKQSKDLAIKKAVSIVTCMDCRLLPDRIFGLELGDAEYIRNAGGRVTDDVIRSLLIAQELLNTKEIVLMHHTDCGAMYASKKHDQFLEKVKNKLRVPGLLWSVLTGFLTLFKAVSGVDLVSYNALPIGPTMKDLENSVVEDVEKLEKSPLIAKEIPIYGVIYHCESGEVTEVTRKRSSQGMSSG
ncbi:hypothetical protein CVIRNUC_002739 [Coccomyxa viridis]|uniref:Carbonic anhydrase n=1 Tax=Coccomyxa viridis TaxID=1274662 RepID=A0AAV1HZN0_9CHLO|nr:hypothetical protein CVIRNUC_002739 [Coccomyxa viridis]